MQSLGWQTNNIELWIGYPYGYGLMDAQMAGQVDGYVDRCKNICMGRWMYLQTYGGMAVWMDKSIGEHMDGQMNECIDGYMGVQIDLKSNGYTDRLMYGQIDVCIVSTQVGAWMDGCMGRCMGAQISVSYLDMWQVGIWR